MLNDKRIRGTIDFISVGCEAPMRAEIRIAGMRWECSIDSLPASIKAHIRFPEILTLEEKIMMIEALE